MHTKTNLLSFSYATLPGGAIAITPCIDGRPLTEIVEKLDERGVAGKFGGLVPEYFNYGPLDAYLTGQGYALGEVPGQIYVLGCECGEVGCNPVTAVVTVQDETVVWSRLQGWETLLSLEPFCFDRRQYEDAVQAMMARLASASLH